MKTLFRLLLILIFLALLGGMGVGYLLMKPNTKPDMPSEFFIHSTMEYEDVLDSLKHYVLAESRGVSYLAGQLNLQNHIYPGIYELEPGLNTIELIRLIRSGKRKEVRVVIPSHIRPVQVFGILGRTLEPDSAEIADAFFNSLIFKDLKLEGAQWACLFQANTYYFNWAGKADDIVGRFQREYENYWDENRRSKASRLGLTPAEVIVLASIVDGESTKMEEMPTIAGVYLNRLRNKWPLQADPTIMYIVKEDGRKRVLNKDKELDHPYNTYIYGGLPPGPIMLASSSSIKAVLEPEDHDFMFFCAKEDFSGYHRFASNYEEHQKNARLYQRELNRRGILE